MRKESISPFYNLKKKESFSPFYNLKQKENFGAILQPKAEGMFQCIPLLFFVIKERKNCRITARNCLDIFLAITGKWCYTIMHGKNKIQINIRYAGVQY